MSSRCVDDCDPLGWAGTFGLCLCFLWMREERGKRATSCKTAVCYWYDSKHPLAWLSGSSSAIQELDTMIFWPIGKTALWKSRNLGMGVLAESTLASWYASAAVTDTNDRGLLLRRTVRTYTCTSMHTWASACYVMAPFSVQEACSWEYNFKLCGRVLTLKSAAYIKTSSTTLPKQPQIAGHWISFVSNNIIKDAWTEICCDLHQQISVSCCQLCRFLFHNTLNGNLIVSATKLCLRVLRLS